MVGMHPRIPWSKPDIGKAEARMVQKVVKSGWLSMGPTVKKFEGKLAEYVGTKHAIMVNNGTSALIAAYLASGIRPGTKVLVPSYTFIATVNALLAMGARPVLMDSDRGTLNVTPEIVEQSLGANGDTRFVVIVDVAGMPCDLDAISEVCDKKGATLIEDAAEALGAECRGRKVGGGEHAAVFSFHAAKLLSTIEGGAITTKDSALAAKVSLIRNHGEAPGKKYWHVAVGLNLRPLEFQGALALAQFPKLGRYIRNRNEIAKEYDSSLKDILEPQVVPEYVTCHPRMFHVGAARTPTDREKLTKHLEKRGIDYRLPWPPVSVQQVGYDFHSECPVAEEVHRRMISLPLYNTMTAAEAKTVIDAVKSCPGLAA